MPSPASSAVLEATFLTSSAKMVIVHKLASSVPSSANSSYDELNGIFSDLALSDENPERPTCSGHSLVVEKSKKRGSDSEDPLIIKKPLNKKA